MPSRIRSIATIITRTRPNPPPIIPPYPYPYPIILLLYHIICKKTKLLILIVNMKRFMQPAPPQKAFHQRNPPNNCNHKIRPICVKMRRPWSKPPKGQSKSQYSIQFS